MSARNPTAFHLLLSPRGQEVYLVGSCDELGAWDLARKARNASMPCMSTQVHMAWTQGNYWTVKVRVTVRSA